MTKNPDGTFKRSYRKWSSMIRRCTSPKSHIWKYYGGRGITVCERWLDRAGYLNFEADMGEPPPGLTLERKDNNLGYSPTNCKWATMKEQHQNKRQRGRVPGSLRDKAFKAGLPYMVVYLRIRNGGWSEERALSTPKIVRTSRLNKYGLGYKNSALVEIPRTPTSGEVSKTKGGSEGVSCIGHPTE